MCCVEARNPRFLDLALITPQQALLLVWPGKRCREEARRVTKLQAWHSMNRVALQLAIVWEMKKQPDSEHITWASSCPLLDPPLRHLITSANP